MLKIVKSRFLSLLLKILLNSIFLSCRWKIIDENNLLSHTNKPRLICCWHSRGLFIARYLKYKKLNAWGISSVHADSEILARILKSWKIQLIRGSSTRGWASVIKKMIVLFKTSSSIIAVTSDGPKGPRKIPKMGSVDIAQKYGAYIIAGSGISNKYWTLPTWDKTKIPKPFSKIYIKFSKISSVDIPLDEQSMALFINKNQEELCEYILANK